MPGDQTNLEGFNMLDIRLPLGLLFVVLGGLLAGYGALTTTDSMYAVRSLGYNVNLYWGLVLAVLGAVVAVGAVKSRFRKR